MAIIECKEVCKSFGEKVALDHVSLDIPEGRIFGLLGPNGAGKTTLIRIINRITIPNSGEVFFKGAPITQKDVEKIGYMPEERGLYRKMKVGDQAMYLARLKGMSAADARVALKDWFVRFDPVNAELIRREILRLKEEGATIILSTHNMESVEELCDNIALINKAKLVVTGGTDEIRHRYGQDNVEIEFTEGVERRQEVVAREGVNARLQELIAEGVRINSFKEVIPRMNDIFIRLVTQEEE